MPAQCGSHLRGLLPSRLTELTNRLGATHKSTRAEAKAEAAQEPTQVWAQGQVDSS